MRKCHSCNNRKLHEYDTAKKKLTSIVCPIKEGLEGSLVQVDSFTLVFDFNMLLTFTKLEGITSVTFDDLIVLSSLFVNING